MKKKLFCKHNYIMLLSDSVVPINQKICEDGVRVKTKIKCGCVIYCPKCGKELKHLSKKIGKIYAQTTAFRLVEAYQKAVKGAEIKTYKYEP